MITGNGDGHHGPHFRPAFDCHDSIGNSTHSENPGLGRSDDGAELVDLIHAEVADSEGGVGDVRRAQLADTSAFENVATVGSDFGQGCGVSVGNDGGYNAVVDGDCYTHVHVRVNVDPFGAPTGVEARMFQQDAGSERDQEVRVSNADDVSALDFYHDAFAKLV